MLIPTVTVNSNRGSNGSVIEIILEFVNKLVTTLSGYLVGHRQCCVPTGRVMYYFLRAEVNRL